MTSLITKIKINNFTYLFILLCFLCGYLKNIMLIFLICLFHELGHIFFIKLFKYSVEEVEILPFGGFTKINEHLNSKISNDLIIALGGFLFQGFFYLILLLFKNHLAIITYNLLVKYNLIIALFNLIPIIPLDGSKVTHHLLEIFFPYEQAYYLNFFLSIIFLIIFLFLNYLYHFDNYFIFSFLIYKLIMYLKNFKYLKKRFLLERYLYNFTYHKIDNHTKDINSLRKGVYHYFKEGSKYVSERRKLAKLFDKDAYF